MSRNPRNPDSTNRGIGPSAKTPAERPPAPDAEDESAIEAFEEEGAGIAAKE
jgi:hypothetical protein